MNPEIGAVDGDQRLSQVLQRRILRRADLPLGEGQAHGTALRVDDLAVADLVVEAPDAVNAERIVAHAELGLLAHLGLRDQVAARRLPARELDSRRRTDQAAPSVATHEVARAQRAAAGEPYGHALLLLLKAAHRGGVKDANAQLGDPRRHDPLDLPLPDPERVGMPRWEIAHLEHGRAEARGLRDLSLREEALGDTALIEHLDRACVQAARPGVPEHMVGTPLEDHQIDPCERELGGEHHPRRARPHDRHRVLAPQRSSTPVHRFDVPHIAAPSHSFVHRGGRLWGIRQGLMSSLDQV